MEDVDCHVKHSILNKLIDFMNVAKKCHWLSHNLDIFPRKYFVLRMIYHHGSGAQYVNKVLCLSGMWSLLELTH